MKELVVLHTSDWHLGHQFHKQRREGEFRDFLKWLAGVCAANSVDILVVAGDIFNTPDPGSLWLDMYYDFLCELEKIGVSHVVATAGNHDSPSVINLGRRLLKKINVHAVGAPGAEIGEDVKVLPGPDGSPALIVCAAPYLRERELLEFVAGESIEDGEARLVEAIKARYAAMAELAETLRGSAKIPVLATGHLYAAGSAATDDEKSMYLGNLAGVPASIFPDSFDYVALGHIHRPQQVGEDSRIRYSGSPLPMTFDEAAHEKSVAIIRFRGRDPQIGLVQVPVFRLIKTIKGDKLELLEELRKLIASSGSERSVWVEADYTGSESESSLYDELRELARGSNVEILAVRNVRARAGALRVEDIETLDDLAPGRIFSIFLDSERPDLPEAGKKELQDSFEELIRDYNEFLRENGNENS